MKRISVVVTLPLLVREKYDKGSLEIRGTYTYNPGDQVSVEEFEIDRILYGKANLTLLFEYLNEEWYFPFMERITTAGIEEGRRLLNSSGEDESDAWRQAELFPEE